MGRKLRERPACEVMSAEEARKKPIKSEPQSPMKMEAGLWL